MAILTEQTYERLREQCETGVHPDRLDAFFYLTQNPNYQPSPEEITGWLLQQKIDAMSYYEGWLVKQADTN